VPLVIVALLGAATSHLVRREIRQAHSVEPAGPHLAAEALQARATLQPAALPRERFAEPELLSDRLAQAFFALIRRR